MLATEDDDKAHVYYLNAFYHPTPLDIGTRQRGKIFSPPDRRLLQHFLMINPVLKEMNLRRIVQYKIHWVELLILMQMQHQQQCFILPKADPKLNQIENVCHYVLQLHPLTVKLIDLLVLG